MAFISLSLMPGISSSAFARIKRISSFVSEVAMQLMPSASRIAPPSFASATASESSIPFFWISLRRNDFNFLLTSLRFSAVAAAIASVVFSNL